MSFCFFIREECDTFAIWFSEYAGSKYIFTVVNKDFYTKGKSFDETNQIFHNIFNTIEEEYKGKKKGIFLSNDNHANILLNIIYRKYGKLPADYQLIGFDDSSISREAIIPITTIQQQIPKMADRAMSVLVDEMNERKKRVPHISNELHHELISPHLIVRQTTNH